MKKLVLFLSLIINFSNFICAMQTIDDASGYYSELMHDLYNQPIFNGVSLQSKRERRILAVNSSIDCKISVLLYDLVFEKIKNPKICGLISHTNKNNSILDSNGEMISAYLELTFFDDRWICPYKKLEEEYKKLIEELKKGWLLTNSKEYLEVTNKEDSDNWHFLIKIKSFKTEITLIEKFIKRFGLKDLIECSEFELIEDSEGCRSDSDPKDYIYLWIKKDAFEKIHEIFKFKID